MLEMSCRSRKTRLKAAPKYAGRKVPCPACKTKIRIPKRQKQLRKLRESDSEDESTANVVKWWKKRVVAALAATVALLVLIVPVFP